MSIASALFENTKLVSQEDSEKEFREAVIWDELMRAMPIKEEMEQFLRSDYAQVMFENGYITEANSVVVLSKLDDLSRRTKMAAIQLAKDKNDPLYKQYYKHKEKERALEEKIMAKYGMIGEKNAKIAQKEYLRAIPNAFTRRVSVAPLVKKK